MVGLYLRVSTQIQALKYSLDTQEKLGKDFCRRNDEDFLIYKEAESGASMEARAEFQRLLSDIKDGKIAKVWVIAHDRLGRDVTDLGIVKRLFIKHNIQLYVSSILQDLSTLEGAFLFNIHATFAEWERGKIIERTTRGAADRKNKGRQVYPDCYGYKRIYDASGHSKWEVIEDEAKVVQLIYGKFASGESLYAINKYLKDEGIRTHKGKFFVIGRISNILRRPIYGGLTYNKAGVLIRSVLYEPIIDEKVWRKLHKDRPRKLRERPYTYAKYVCSGIIKCKECGIAYIKTIKAKHHPHWHYGLYPYYRAQHLTRCENRGNFKSLLIETILPRTFFLMYEDIPKLQGLWEKKMKDAIEADEANRDRIERFKKQLTTYRKQRDNLIDSIADGTIKAEEAKGKMESIRGEIDKLEEDLNRMPSVKAEKEWDYILKAFGMDRQQEFLDAFDDAQREKDWKKVGTQIKKARELLKEVLKTATIYHGILHIEYINGWAADIDLHNLPIEYNIGVPTKEVDANGLTVFVPLSEALKDRRRKLT